MGKACIFVKNTRTLLEKRANRCNRNIQQINEKQAGDAVGAGDVTIHRAFSYRISGIDGCSFQMN